MNAGKSVSKKKLLHPAKEKTISMQILSMSSGRRAAKKGGGQAYSNKDGKLLKNLEKRTHFFQLSQLTN